MVRKIRIAIDQAVQGFEKLGKVGQPVDAQVQTHKIDLAFGGLQRRLLFHIIQRDDHLIAGAPLKALASFSAAGFKPT